jgi:hypothetical protein
MIDPETGRFIAAAEMMPDNFAFNAASHFLKAVRKHPRFADALFFNGERDERMREDALQAAELDLEETREDLYLSTRDGSLDARFLLSCEMEEAFVEHLRGDAAACVDELYDAVAVLMRMIAVVEGKQKLGRKDAK